MCVTPGVCSSQASLEVEFGLPSHWYLHQAVWKNRLAEKQYLYLETILKIIGQKRKPVLTQIRDKLSIANLSRLLLFPLTKLPGEFFMANMFPLTILPLVFEEGDLLTLYPCAF